MTLSTIRLILFIISTNFPIAKKPSGERLISAKSTT